MANYEADFNLIIDFESNTLRITDTTRYDLVGGSPDSSFLGYIKQIKSPNGTDIYLNPVVDANPDFDGLNPSSTVQIDIPKYEDGSYQTGQFFVDIEIVSSSDNYTKSKTLTFLGYTKPTLKVDADYDCVTPLFSVEDNTDYSLSQYSNLEPRLITRLHTIDYPKAGIPDLTGTDKKLETAVFYSTTQTVSFKTTIQYSLTPGDDLLINDVLESSQEVVVICLEDLCQVYALVESLNTKYETASKYGDGQKWKENWSRAVGLLAMIKQAISCGKKENLDGYRKEIQELSGDCDCGCGEGDEPVLITGYNDEGTIENHNALQGLQGGDSLNSEFYHLNEADYNGVRSLLYQPPTLSLSPSTVGSTIEVGAVLNISQLISISIGNQPNVHLNRVDIDGNSQFIPDPAEYTLNFNGRLLNNGSNTLSTVFIRRSDNLNQIIETVNAIARYAVYYFIIPVSFDDIMDDQLFDDQELQTVIQGGNQDFSSVTFNKVLRSNRLIGNIEYNPTVPSNIYIACPVSYGTPRIAPQAFPTAFVNTSVRDFTYTNSLVPTSITTPYRLVKMTDNIGGQYFAKHD